ncbi:hypothetical protein GBA52_028740 [Prunus armeniaca]|nr:hypothetical protein GBA52_028740 [Prunus armeniaca]
MRLSSQEDFIQAWTRESLVIKAYYFVSLGSEIRWPNDRVGVARPLRKYNARVCVEIDLLKPRPNRIWLGMGAGGKWRKIIYERVPKFCSHCMLRGRDN